MSNRFIDKIAYLDGLSPSTARSRASALVKAASRHGVAPSIAQRDRFGMSAPFSADERALVVLMENGGIDLGVGAMVDRVLAGLPGGTSLPGRDALVRLVDEKIRETTDNLLENAEMVINRYSSAAPGSYSSVHMLRNGTGVYSALKDKLIELTRSNRIIDLFVLTHGSSDSIALEGSERINGDKIKQIRSVHNGGQPIRLRAVYMMNCVGSSLNPAWLEIGAKVSAGSLANNYIPEPTMYYFFRNWKAGQTFGDAVRNAYDSTISTIEGILKSGLRVAGPARGLIPGLDAILAALADIENMQVIRDSAPVVSGDGGLTIGSDALSFSQSTRTRTFAYLPLSSRPGPRPMPRAMWAPGRTMTHTISARGVDFIKSFEGFRGTLYNDPAGHCTIGYGHLVHTGNCNGAASEAPFTAGITEAEATALMHEKLREFELAVNQAVTVEMEPHQFDALVSFSYNIGIGRVASGSTPGTGFLGSTLLRRLNAGEYDAVPSELARWNKAGGQVLPGLTRRRAAEGRMFSAGDYSTTQSLNLRHRGLDDGRDPIREAELLTEGDERPDGAGVVQAFETSVAAHCPINPATTAGTTNFSLQEFASRDGAPTPEGIRGNIQRLMEQLEVLRSELGDRSVAIVSGYRSPAHNSAVDGKPHSQHLCGRAADIRVADHTPAEVHGAIERLIAAGRMMEGGLGLYSSFVHYDTRGTRARW
jgi:GH24 family phage-related lysozyme (muramidase)